VNAKSTSAPQFRNPSFTTPRKPFDLDLFSEASGAESSPADTADVEDTPEIHKINTAMAVLQTPSEKKPIFGRYGRGFLGSSPGRADLRRGKLANTITHKLRKRRRIDRETQAIGVYSDSDSDSGESRQRSKKGHTAYVPQQGWFSTLLTGIESRPQLPNVLATYIQFFTNGFFFLVTVFGVWTAFSAIKADVDKAAQESIARASEEIGQCARDYVDNRCVYDQRAPSLKQICSDWEVCMGRDANQVGRARVSASVLAGIINNFVEPISYKAMVSYHPCNSFLWVYTNLTQIFLVVAITVVVLVNNMAFGSFRAKHTPHVPSAAQYFPPPPPMPQNFEWGTPVQTTRHNVGYDHWGNDVKSILPSQTPSGRRSPSKGSRSPSKVY
jgi:hypothetical protein